MAADPAHARPDPRQGACALTWHGESLELLVDRAMWWPARGMLLVADVHLGKDASFRLAGVPVPAGEDVSGLARLTHLVSGLDARELVILGDLVHAEHAVTAALRSEVSRWTSALGGCRVTLVRGNHDPSAGSPFVEVEAHEAPLEVGPFDLVHDPEERGDRPAIAGHRHPGVRLRGPGGDRARLPCFAVDDRRIVLPAFGGLTGLSLVAPGEGATRYAVTPGGVRKLRP